MKGRLGWEHQAALDEQRAKKPGRGRNRNPGSAGKTLESPSLGSADSQQGGEIPSFEIFRCFFSRRPEAKISKQDKDRKIFASSSPPPDLPPSCVYHPAVPGPLLSFPASPVNLADVGCSGGRRPRGAGLAYDDSGAYMITARQSGNRTSRLAPRPTSQGVMGRQAQATGRGPAFAFALPSHIPQTTHK